MALTILSAIFYIKLYQDNDAARREWTCPSAIEFGLDNNRITGYTDVRMKGFAALFAV